MALCVKAYAPVTAHLSSALSLVIASFFLLLVCSLDPLFSSLDAPYYTLDATWLSLLLFCGCADAESEHLALMGLTCPFAHLLLFSFLLPLCEAW
jgi:hypothetical protein